MCWALSQLPTGKKIGQKQKSLQCFVRDCLKFKKKNENGVGTALSSKKIFCPKV